MGYKTDLSSSGSVLLAHVPSAVSEYPAACRQTRANMPFTNALLIRSTVDVVAVSLGHATNFSAVCKSLMSCL